MSRNRDEVRRLKYSRARLTLLGVGIAVLLLIAAMMLARGVVRDEVIAIVFFIPIFVAFVFWNERGGLSVGLIATAAYVWLLRDAIETVGFDRLLGQFGSRAIGYLLFGFLGGWANRELEQSLNKLELYDQIDDRTGLFNARFILQDTDLEISRSKRYQTIFSVAVVEIPNLLLEPLSRRQVAGLLRELGRLLRSSVRTVDRVVHGAGHEAHKFAVILPETGREGVMIFAARLNKKLEEHLSKRGMAGSEGRLRTRSMTHPGNEDQIEILRQEFAVIDRLEHPEDVEVIDKQERATSDEGVS